MAWQTQYVEWQANGQALATAAAVAADGVVGSALDLGRGLFLIDVTVADYVGGDAFDSLNIVIQANTSAATTTWNEIGNIVIGDAAGRGVALTSVTNAIVPVVNQAHNQVRVYAYINGSAVSATVTANAYPAATAAI